jgi:hypothetical protein
MTLHFVPAKSIFKTKLLEPKLFKDKLLGKSLFKDKLFPKTDYSRDCGRLWES